MRPPQEVRLTGNSSSAVVRTVILFCRLANIPCELTRTPITRLPDGFVDADMLVGGMVAERGNFRSTSLVATLRYLAALRPALASKWCGDDAAGRALVDDYLEWHVGVLRPASLRVLLLTILHHAKGPTRPAEAHDVESATKAYIEALQTLEARYLVTESFLAGTSVTLADLTALAELSFHRMLDVKLDVSFPRVGAWLRKVAVLRYWDEVCADFEDCSNVVQDAARLHLQAEARKAKQQRSDAVGGTRPPDVAHVVRFASQSPSEVYAALTDPERQSVAFKSRCTFMHSVGGEFSAYDGLVHGTSLYLEEGRKLLQRWRASDWPTNHFSMVRIQLRDAGEGNTELLLSHSDAPPDQAKRLDELWNVYFWRPLEGVLTRGLAETVFIENAAPHDVYEILLDSSRLTKLVHSKCTISKAVGGDFELYDGAVTGKHVSLVTDQKIVQKWRGKDWPQAYYSQVVIELARVAGGAELRFMQTDVPVDRYMATVETWRKQLFKRLMRLEPKRPGTDTPVLLISSTVAKAGSKAAAPARGPTAASPVNALHSSSATSSGGSRLSRGGPGAGSTGAVAASSSAANSSTSDLAATGALGGSMGADAKLMVVAGNSSSRVSDVRRPEVLQARDMALLYAASKVSTLKRGDLWPTVKLGFPTPPRVALFRIRNGELKLEGKRVMTLTSADGECGERQLFDVSHEPLRARCSSDTAEVAVIEASALASVLDSDEALAARFSRYHAARFARLLLLMLSVKDTTKVQELRRREADTSADVEPTERDVVLRTYFDLPEALLLREWLCSKVAQPIAKAGALLVTQRHFVFYPRTVSVTKKKKRALAYADVERIERDVSAHRLTVHCSMKKKLTLQLDKATYDEVSAFFARYCTATESGSDLRNRDKFSKRFVGDSTLMFSQALLPEDWTALSAIGQVSKHSKGEVLMQEGKKYPKLFVLIAGTCRFTVSRPPEGKAVTQVGNEARIESGELFGDAEWLLGGMAASYTVTADTDAVELRSLGTEALQELLTRNLPLATRFYLHLIGDLLVRTGRQENIGRAALDYLM